MRLSETPRFPLQAVIGVVASIVCTTQLMHSSVRADPWTPEANVWLEVQFDLTGLAAEPVIVDYKIQLHTASGYAVIAPDSASAVHLQPSLPRTSQYFNRLGPWITAYSTELSVNQLIQRLEEIEGIAWVKERVLSGDLLGEIVASDFPSTSHSHFYNASQKMLHVVLPPGLPESERHPEDPSTWDDHTYTADFDMDLPQAWAITKGDPSVVVAIVDTGVNLQHVELAGQALNTDPIGAGPDPECPGLCGVDENGNGIVDEDPAGFLPGNLGESMTPQGPENVLCSVVTGIPDQVTVQTSGNWAAGALVGWVIDITPSGSRYCEHPGIRIGDNTAVDSGIMTITTETDDPVMWENFAVGHQLRVANNVDDDGDGRIDDLGYDQEAAALDDDENGFIDDYQGWDFAWSQVCLEDNDPSNPRQNHGTGIAGAIAAKLNAGLMVGIAPGVKLLPIKTMVDALQCGTTGTATLDQRIVEYCATKGADILSTSFSAVHGQATPDLSALVTDTYGMLHTNGAGNAEIYREHGFAGNPRAIIVAGVEPGGWPWFNEGDIKGTNFHETVDISASAIVFGSVWECGSGSTPPNNYTTWEGTSFAGPLVAGVLALMKSAYPDWDNDVLRAKLLLSTQPILPFDPGHTHPGAAELDGKLGSGALNAYRALSFYGDLTQFNIPLVWSDDVWVSGDVVIPAGVELVIEPGTTIHVAQDDILDAGTDPRMLEWVVAGTITALGTSSEPIVFEIFDDEPSTQLTHNPNRLWGHFKLASTGVLNFEHVQLDDLLPRDTATGIVPAGTVINPGNALAFSWTTEYVESEHNPPLVYEASVRIRGSIDGGQSFDTGTTYPVSAGVGLWTASAASADRELVVRVEFLDAGGLVIGYDDFDAYHVIPPFANVSSSSGITIPQTSTPYASTTLDYDADGDEDLVVSYTNDFAQLYRNDGVDGEAVAFNNFAFTELGNGSVGNTKGVNRLDYSNDGAVDLFLAGTNGSRLFRGSTSQPGNLTEEMTSLLGSAASQASSASAWGDYNKDGFLDVYLVRDVSDVLLKAQTNAQGQFTGYTDVSTIAGLYTATDKTTSAMWADLDKDSWLDLFVTWGDVKSYQKWCYYYRNLGPVAQGNHVFDDVTEEPVGPGVGALGLANAVDFADLNGDNWLDLILARELPPPGDGFPNLLVCFNDGSGGLRVEPGPEFGINNSELIADVEITDLDGNGILDVLAIPKDGSAPILHYAREPAGSLSYWNGTLASSVGTGTTYGLSVADFNRDSDPDILLLRPESGPNPTDKKFLWSNPRFTTPPSSGQERFLTVTLAAMPQGANRLGLGATVTVIVTTPGGETLRSTQVVDGGSGKGGQGSGRLAFGLADASTAAIHVHWPHGVAQYFPDAATLDGFPNVTVSYTVDPLIDPTSLSATYTPSQNSATHQYKWRTGQAGGNPEVMVTIASPITTACKVPLGGATQMLLKAGVSGVSVTSVPLVGGGQEHTVTWTTYCEAVCNYSYSVHNVVGGQLYMLSGGALTVNVCGGFGE